MHVAHVAQLLMGLCLQELDEAARRRMPRQLYVALPDDTTRKEMFQRKLGKHGHLHPTYLAAIYDHAARLRNSKTASSVFASSGSTE